MAALRIVSAFRFSKRIGLKMLVSEELVKRDDGSGGFLFGCLSWRTSQMDRRTGSEPGDADGIISSRLRTPPVEFWDR